MAWRLFDHTADVGIEADGVDAAEVLAHAAHALTSVITGTDQHFRGGEEHAFRVEAPDLEALAVAFLAELLWLFEEERILWSSGGMAVTQTDDGWAVDAAGNFTTLDAAHSGVEVKAVTYHQLFFGRRGAKWHLRVVLDI